MQKAGQVSYLYKRTCFPAFYITEYSYLREKRLFKILLQKYSGIPMVLKYNN